MINLTEEQKEFLKAAFEDKAQAMIDAEDVNDILDPLNDLIVEKGLNPENDWQPTKWGNEAYRIYDQIYDQNPD